MTEEMLELARRNAAEAGIANVEFLHGYLEDIPLPDDTVDVVISNCVINLAADTMRGLLVSLSAEPDFAEQVAEHLDQTDVQHILRSVLQRAAERDEINATRITPRVIALPMDLLRNEHLLRGAPVSDTAIVEIVDQILLPLLRPLTSPTVCPSGLLDRRDVELQHDFVAHQHPTGFQRGVPGDAEVLPVDRG
jgi:SAM-dependent methyltransferase